MHTLVLALFLGPPAVAQDPIAVVTRLGRACAGASCIEGPGTPVLHTMTPAVGATDSDVIVRERHLVDGVPLALHRRDMLDMVTRVITVSGPGDVVATIAPTTALQATHDGRWMMSPGGICVVLTLPDDAVGWRATPAGRPIAGQAPERSPHDRRGDLLIGTRLFADAARTTPIGRLGCEPNVRGSTANGMGDEGRGTWQVAVVRGTDEAVLVELRTRQAHLTAWVHAADLRPTEGVSRSTHTDHFGGAPIERAVPHRCAAVPTGTLLFDAQDGAPVGNAPWPMPVLDRHRGWVHVELRTMWGDLPLRARHTATERLALVPLPPWRAPPTPITAPGPAPWEPATALPAELTITQTTLCSSTLTVQATVTPHHALELEVFADGEPWSSTIARGRLEPLGSVSDDGVVQVYSEADLATTGHAPCPRDAAACHALRTWKAAPTRSTTSTIPIMSQGILPDHALQVRVGLDRIARWRTDPADLGHISAISTSRTVELTPDGACLSWAAAP